MADKKITQLTNITGANLVDADEFVVVDISADETKAITLGELKEAFDSGSGFVRTTGDTMTGDLALSGADVTFGDNDKAIFGAGSDLQIYHASSTNNSVIQETGSGNLLIYASNISMADAGGNEFILMTDTGTGGTVELKHTTSTKLATTSTGIDVTGTVTADGLTVDGGSAISNTVASQSPALTLQNLNTGAYGTGIAFENNFLGTTFETAAIKTLVGNQNGYLQFYTTDTGTSKKRLQLDNNGDISFYEDTGTTAKFFWDASAEKLGLGTTSPDHPITIQSSSDMIKMIDAQNTSVYHRLYSASDSSLVLSADAGNANSGQLRFFTTDTERMRISSSGDLEMTGGGSVGWANWTITESGGSLYFATGGTNKMKLDASGNLQVVGNVESNATIT